MIKQVLDLRDVALVTAPPRFGKSTNLDMLKRFLEIEVDEVGNPVTKANLTTDAVTDTNNYKLFVDNKLKITRNMTFVGEHFGKTPVILVDYKCPNIIKTFEDAIDFCKEVIHRTFQQHKYLLSSDRLTPYQKSFFEKWCNESTYMNLTKHHVTHGIRVLSTYLYRHFDRRAFVLIDEHDSIIGKAMFDVSGADVLRKIIALSVSMMSTSVKNNDLYVKGGLISGIADIPVFGFSDLNNLQTFRFLEDHRFLHFYGLTENEAKKLLKKPEFEMNSSLIEEAHEWYNGYQSEQGWKIYNTYSFMRFLKLRRVQNFWTKYCTIKLFRNVFKIPAFKSYIDKLIEGKSISIVVTEKLSVEDVIDLRNLLLRPLDQINYWPATLFNYLLRQGFLTFMPRQTKNIGISVKQTTVKIPNAEVREYIEKLRV